MKKYVAQTLDHIGLLFLHSKKSNKSHFYYQSDSVVEELLQKEMEKIYPAPTLPDLIFDKQESKGGYETGRFIDERVKGDSNIEGQLQDHPMSQLQGHYYIKEVNQLSMNVIIVHGWRSDSLDRVKKTFLKPFTELGYNLFFVYLPYHFERAAGTAYSGEYMISANVERSIESIKQAVQEIRALIHWIKKQDGGKVSLIGISFGGFIANLTSVVEDQIDQLISIMYPNNLSYEIWHTRIGKYIKQDFEQHGFTYEQLQKAWSILEPERSKPKVQKENILFITSLYDQYIDRKDSDQLWEAWDRPKRLLYPCGYAGFVTHKKRMAIDVTAFIEERKIEKIYSNLR